LNRTKQNHSSLEIKGKHLQNGIKINVYAAVFVMLIVLMAPSTEQTTVILKQTWINAKDAVFVTVNVGLEQSPW
jgi:hypothetical protein